MLPSKQFQCRFHWRWPFLVLSRKIADRFLFLRLRLLQAIDSVMSLALCPQVLPQATQHFRSSETKAACDGWMPASLSAPSFPLTPACPGQYTHRILRRWMSNIDTCQSGLPIPLFTFCSRLIESVRIMACVVWLSPPEVMQRSAWATASFF